MSARNPSRKLPRWQIYMIRGARGSMLGIIRAIDEAEALKEAFAEFYVEPADRERIVVQRVVDG